MNSWVTKSGEVVVVCWYDNSSVNVASTFVGIGATDMVNRWSTKEKAFVPADRPEAIKLQTSWVEWTRWTFSSPSTLCSSERKDGQQESFSI